MYHEFECNHLPFTETVLYTCMSHLCQYVTHTHTHTHTHTDTTLKHGSRVACGLLQVPYTWELHNNHFKMRKET